LRWVWFFSGHLLLVVGFVGVFVPLLPGTPLLILAAFCYSKGSEKFESWLLNHPRFGTAVRDWRTHRVIPKRAKVLALTSMSIGLLFPFVILDTPLALKVATGIVVVVVALLILSFPSQRSKI
jgi:uncharacterized membrane protein YbaN (DUF454 family)